MRHRLARLLPAQALTVLVGGLLATSLPASGGADSAPALLQRAHALRAENTALGARTHEALLRLYALDSQLARARARLDGLTAQAARVRQERALTANRLTIARGDLATAQAQLAERLRDLYEQGQTDPLAILLGARSLDEALAGIDDLNRAARLDRRLISETRRARAHQQAVALALARRSATLERLRRDAAAAASVLAATRAQHTTYLASLRAKERLNGARIASLESAAAAARAKAATLVAAAPPTPAASSPATPSGPGTMGVVATGYSLGGNTATGLPVGWGVVAVDPSVIPLGTRMSIPGYGEGVAADVGSGISGAMVDLWFPSDSAARAWGRRAVTITLH
ncbi:MAG TPA: 3D domain-containing protein [Gaiellaceae bacterium]|nr:3D domain-containing protein [Gaiellaceae bacterium]